ncbi:YcbK family protein [Methylibium petroleiphilum]|uniref:Murein endopeptidase K n=1 Tax=Methylibium petroleiphilum (strain ATCC BAA-1232 / LMG 22953 / PM1) TaxID=420662 RepID=A2SMP6_METPP|nr:DUF882 domain-containing protein [Methylibium petroleiphilum]ABM96835.1 conserved hypothetical protein [Methylibium petroleiphilum PM1]
MVGTVNRAGTTRRSVLLVAAWATMWRPAASFAQNVIENSPEAGPGWEPPKQIGTVSTPTATPVVAGPPVTAAGDWRQFLLSGERSIVVRRNGPRRRIRYMNHDGSVDRDGYGLACFMLRDVRAGKVVAMDPKLLDVLCGIQRWMEFNGRTADIELLSGFRTGVTNQATEGAARNSMHLYGKAADIHIDGASSALVGAMVQVFNRGGTGVYLNRGFVHVDTGAQRTWVSTARRGS